MIAALATPAVDVIDSVTVVLVTATTVAPLGMPEPLTFMPTTTAVVEAKFRTLPFAAVSALVARTTDRPAVPCA